MVRGMEVIEGAEMYYNKTKRSRESVHGEVYAYKIP